jgi:hypothetical protein
MEQLRVEAGAAESHGLLQMRGVAIACKDPHEPGASGSAAVIHVSQVSLALLRGST